MPLYCPLFPTAQADGTRTCLRCGAVCPPDPETLLHNQAALKSAASHPPGGLFDMADTLPFLPMISGSWKMPTLAGGVMLALIGAALLFAPHPPRIRVAAWSQLATKPKTTLPQHKAHAVPLGVTLVSSDKSRHVRVGSPLILTAYTTPAHGRSAKLALSYQRGSGPRTRFSFAQGNLCSAAWTPLAPGQYTFTATAHDDHRQIAISRSLAITVDNSQSHNTARSQIASTPPSHVVGHARSHRSLPLVHSLPAVLPLPAPPPPPVFHVVAARFPHSGNAAILATALQNNGLHAEVRRTASRRWGVGYVVETGAYQDKEEAQRQSLVLQRNGYPAYYFGKP